jgi:4-hydroxy-2-oxoheptanedioate aldolase
MQALELRQAMRAGQRVYGTLVSAPATLWVKQTQGAALDFVFIDTEHIPNDRQTLSWMCHAYRAIDLPPIVRVPSPDPYEACKVLDGGACGVIFPYTETVEQVRHLVGACRYRPLKGHRLQEALDDPNSLEPELRTYLEQRNAASIAVVNIESVPAIENLEALLTIDGLDAVLIGPHDLSCSLGIPEQYDLPRFDEAVRTIFSKARAAGKGAGIHYFQEGLTAEIQWIEAGGNFVIHAGDVHFYRQTLNREINALRTALGDERQTDGEATII